MIVIKTNESNVDSALGVRDFSVDTQGFAGAYTNEYVKTWQSVKFQDGVEDWLLLQLGSKSIADTLYALVGLKIMRSPHYEDASNALSKQNDQVSFCSGGYAYANKPIAQVIDYIKAKELKSPL